LASALQLPLNIAAIVAMEPIAPPHLIKWCNEGLESLVPPPWLPRRESVPAILAMHGEKDRISPLPFYQPLYDWFMKIGMSVEISVPVGASHGIGFLQLSTLRSYLMQLVPPPAADWTSDQTRAWRAQFSIIGESEKGPMTEEEATEMSLRKFADQWKDPAERIWMSLLQPGNF
jgi:hypothetical protein